MQHGDATVTRLTVRLTDRAQEQRFRADDLRAGRTVVVATLSAILVCNLGIFVYRRTILDTPIPDHRWIAQITIAVVGAALIVALIHAQRYRVMAGLLVAAVLAKVAYSALLFATGSGVGTQGALLLVGGLAVIYFMVPLPLPAVAALAAATTAALLPFWLAATADTPSGADSAAYTVMAILLAHVLCLLQVRRSNRERRLLFAQSELLRHLSTTDALTHLPNRRSVDEALDLAWCTAVASGADLSVLMLDLDRFKTLNDSQGHIVGDRALRLVADTIADQIALIPGTMAGRYGGEEFCCILADIDLAQAEAIGESIRLAVRRAAFPLTAGSGDLLTISAGVATLSDYPSAPDDLLAAADRALYRAKDSGRDCTRVSGVTAS